MNRDNFTNTMKAQSIMETEFEWRKWIKEIPYLQFPADWNIKIIPPFAGAIVRFQVAKDEKWVSIYLDCYDKLGFFGEPYWEIYPYCEDVARFKMNDTENLLSAIKDVLEGNDCWDNLDN